MHEQATSNDALSIAAILAKSPRSPSDVGAEKLAKVWSEERGGCAMCFKILVKGPTPRLRELH
jgi:hypothetical protein